MPMIKRGKYRSQAKKISYAVIIAFAIIAFWRGVWGLLDEYLFPAPGNEALSYSVSIIIGLSILYFTKHIFDELM